MQHKRYIGRHRDGHRPRTDAHRVTGWATAMIPAALLAVVMYAPSGHATEPTLSADGSASSADRQVTDRLDSQAKLDYEVWSQSDPASRFVIVGPDGAVHEECAVIIPGDTSLARCSDGWEQWS